MKNIVQLTSPHEVDRYVREIWKTEAFRESHDAEDGYIRKWVERFKKYPRFFCDYTEEDLERHHFTAWMNVLPHREYSNGAISDLYYLHELAHMATLPYTPGQPWRMWETRMWDNERMASLESEVMVYFALPELRTETFPFEIWADRFLDNRVQLSPDFDTNQEFCSERFADFVRTLTRHRLRVMMAPNPNDPIEQQIAQYGLLNEDFSDIWRARHEEVETAVSEFQALSNLSRPHGASGYKIWLEEKVREGDGVPFRREAEEFTAAISRRKEAGETIGVRY